MSPPTGPARRGRRLPARQQSGASPRDLEMRPDPGLERREPPAHPELRLQGAIFLFEGRTIDLPVVEAERTVLDRARRSAAGG
jgi:hypothetical protein